MSESSLSISLRSDNISGRSEADPKVEDKDSVDGGTNCKGWMGARAGVLSEIPIAGDKARLLEVETLCLDVMARVVEQLCSLKCFLW